MNTRQDLSTVEEQVLIEQVLSSQNNPDNGATASAAMTELTRRDFNFSKNLRELQNIHIPGAHLAGAILTGVDFTGSDLSRVCLAHAQCMMTIFNHCQLQGIQFGQEAPIQAEGQVLAVAYHPLEEDIVAYAVEKEIHICRRSTGERLQTLTGHKSYVYSITYRPDGRQLASSSGDTTVRIWDSRTGACEQTLRGHKWIVNSVAYRPDGLQLASSSQDHTVRLWDLGSGACEQTLTGHTSYVYSVAYRPDGGQLASGSGDATVRLWDVPSGACEQTLTGHTSIVYSVAYHPDGMQLASGSGDNTVRLWDVPSGVCEQTLTGHTNRVNSVAYRPHGGQLASSSNDYTVRLWDVLSGTCEQALTGHEHWVSSVAYRPDGLQLASSSQDHTVRLWDLGSGACEQTLTGHTDRVNSVAYRPDGGQLASSSNDKTVRLWDPLSGACEQTLTGHTRNVNSVAYRPEGRQLASGSQDKTVRLWDRLSGACEQTLTGHTSTVQSVAYRPEGRQLASGSWDTTVRLWDPLSGACEQTLTGHTGYVYSVAYRPDGGQLASSSNDKTVRLWDPLSGACEQTLRGHTNRVLSVAYRPEGRQLASGSSDNTVRLWGVASGECLQIITNHKNEVTCVNYSADAHYLFSASKSETIVYSLTGDEVIPLMHLPGCVSVSLSGTLVAFGGGGSANQVISFDMNTIERWIQTVASGGRELKLQQSHYDGAQGLTENDHRLLAYYHAQALETIELLEASAGAAEKKSQDEVVAVDEPEEEPEQEQAEQGQEQVEQLQPAQVQEEKQEETQEETQEEQEQAGEAAQEKSETDRSSDHEGLLRGHLVELEEKPLGVGGFGAVYKGRWRHQDVAVKTYTGDRLPERLAREVENEVTVMLQLMHDCLIRFFGVVTQSDAPPMLVMEYCSNGSLYNFLHSDQAILWTLRLRIAHEIIRGLAFLHEENIVHADLKSLNVVLDEHSKAKLCDFGLSQLRLHSKTTTKDITQGTAGGTLRWMAPELFSRRTSIPSRASDIWAYGMVLFELMARKLPFHDADDDLQIKDFIKDTDDRGEEIPEACASHCPSIGPIMQRCWQERTERPDANSLVEDIAAVEVLVDVNEEYDVADNESIAVRPAQATTDPGVTPSYNLYR